MHGAATCSQENVNGSLDASFCSLMYGLPGSANNIIYVRRVAGDLAFFAAVFRVPVSDNVGHRLAFLFAYGR